jgi:small subunit ribosomal protein S6e
MFALDQGLEKGTLAEHRDDVRRYVVRREVTREGKPTFTKAPKIQRLITKDRIRRKEKAKAEKKERWERAKTAKKNYEALIEKVHHERNVAHQAALAAQRAQAS